MSYEQLAQNMLAGVGGLGAVQIAPMQAGMAAQQQGMGQPMMIYPQQIGAQPALAVNNLHQRPVDYTQAAYQAGGLTLMGFPRTVIPAGSTGTQLQINVRRPFLPQSLWMPSTVFGLQLVDFIVEGIGLFANSGGQGVPNELLSEVSNMPQIQWMTLNPETGGQFVIANPTGGDLVFSGCFWGTNLQRLR
jgi:hypothetical protein